MKGRWGRQRMKVIAGFLILIPIGLWLAQVIRSGPCVDEMGHVPAGVYHLLSGRMDAYRVNPPLPRLIAALPLLLDRPEVDWSYSESPYVRNEFDFASDWLLSDPSMLRRQLILSRMMMLIFFIIGLFSIVCWTKDLYGARAAWIAAALWSLSPDILTYSAVVMPDLPATSTGLLLGYRYWSWLVFKPRKFPWGVAICLALAVLCKFTWLFLFALLPLVTLVYDTRIQKPFDVRTVRDSCRLATSFLLTILIINWCYGFDGTGKRLGDFEFISTSLSGETLAKNETGNRFSGQFFASVPVPLPQEMIRGIDYLKWEFEQGYPCYLNGKWSSRGWWYFYLFAMAIKMPLGYWLLMVMGLISLGISIVRRSHRVKGEWLALLLGGALMVLVSSQTGFTHHVRYVLPVYGFLFVVASRFTLFLPPRWIIVFAVLGLSGTIAFHCKNLGMSHVFFNPLAGGPNEGWRYLGASNVDYGQSTYRILSWIESNPQVRPLRVQFCRDNLEFKPLIRNLSGVSIHHDPLESSELPKGNHFLVLSSCAMTDEKNRNLWDDETWARPYADMLVFRVDESVTATDDFSSKNSE